MPALFSLINFKDLRDISYEMIFRRLERFVFQKFFYGHLAYKFE